MPDHPPPNPLTSPGTAASDRLALEQDLTAVVAAEVQRYGISALRLTAVALEQWGFPREMVTPLTKVEEVAAPEGALLRAAFEVAGRLTFEHYEPVPVDRLTGDLLAEDVLSPVLEKVRADAEELRRAMLGE